MTLRLLFMGDMDMHMGDMDTIKSCEVVNLSNIHKVVSESLPH